MIKIQFYSNGFIVSGHANYAKYGEDILCAGVSAIVMGALNWFVEDDVVIEVKEGYISLKVLNNLEDNKKLLNLLKIQLRSLNYEKYSQHLSFTETNERLS